MSTIFLVRHAQASFGTADYDRLSPLGRQQSRWLGEHFAARGLVFTRALAGTMRRQRDTATELLAALPVAPAEIETHAGLDEYPGEALYAAFTAGADPVAHQRRDYRDYWKTFRAVMTAWSEDRLAPVPETWAEFGARMNDALAHAARDTRRDDAVLVVSSGGAIGRWLSALIDAPPALAIELNLQHRNTGFCELVAARGGFKLVSFNCIPHLERADRRDAITHA